MKRKINLYKTMIIFSLLLLIFLKTNKIVYAREVQLDTRRLIFNEGIYSDNIRLLKDFFRIRGEANVTWGYEYDIKTKNLVKEYQKSKGLKADGILGDKTLSYINDEIKKNNYRIGIIEPSINNKGRLLIINKSSNTLYLIENGEIIDIFPVATGKKYNLTPNGKHRIVLKLQNPDWGGAGVSNPIGGGDPSNPLGTRWIGISYGGGGKYGIHGNSNPKSIGKKVSLGCIRMFNSDVEKIYNKVKPGDSVWIGDEDLLKSYGVQFLPRYSPYAGYREVQHTLILDGKKIQVGKVINKDDRNYYPFREILELVGAEVKWDQESKTATGILGNKQIEFTVNSNSYSLNGKSQTLENGENAFIYGDKTYIPIRVTLEGFGMDVHWDGEKEAVIINR